jgi:hypothetical protein
MRRELTVGRSVGNQLYMLNWRKAANAIALLALLFNAALLPADHVGRFVEATAYPAREHSPHHRQVDDEKSPKHGKATHQVCHFCRLAGSALPPPPSIIVEHIRVAQDVCWQVAEQPARRPDHCSAANLPRAPPPLG